MDIADGDDLDVTVNRSGIKFGLECQEQYHVVYPEFSRNASMSNNNIDSETSTPCRQVDHILQQHCPSPQLGSESSIKVHTCLQVTILQL